MSLLAPTLQGFFTERLGHQQQASPRTADSGDSVHAVRRFSYTGVGGRVAVDAELVGRPLGVTSFVLSSGSLAAVRRDGQGGVRLLIVGALQAFAPPVMGGPSVVGPLGG